MAFTHLLRKSFPTIQRTLLLSKSNNNNKNVVFHHHKNLLTGGNTMFQGNPRRTFSSKTSSDPSLLMERFGEKLGGGIRSFIVFGSILFIGLGFPGVGKERVPYTGRDHWVFELDRSLLVKFARYSQEKKKKTDKRILPVNSKESIRVQAVMEKLIQALNDSLRLENGSTIHFYGGNQEDEQLLITIQEGNHNNKGSEKGQSKTSTKHLEKKMWEVVVLDDSDVDSAYLLPCGILKIFSGLLDKLQDDTELATILARQIGCVVARHDNEISRFLSFITSISLLPKNTGMHYQLLATHLVCAFFSRWRELEADYIGLMLMASAGYDPRLAPEVYPKLHTSSIEDYIVGFPSATKRRDKLQDPEVMEKALTIYREVKEGRGFVDSL